MKNLEIEYKLLCSKEQFDHLSALYQPLEFVKQVNTYYDTADEQLRKLHCAMRIREKQGSFIFTLKEPMNDGHLEHEWNINENSVNALLHHEEIMALLNRLNIHGELQTTASLETYRAVVKLDQAELCFDINHYSNHTDYEIEYECTKPHDGKLVFNQILSQANLHYDTNCKSKIARALSCNKV